MKARTDLGVEGVEVTVDAVHGLRLELAHGREGKHLAVALVDLLCVC
jgi:hypothetical protein